MRGELADTDKEKRPSRLELAGLLGGTALFTTVAGAAGGYTFEAFKTAGNVQNYLEGWLYSGGTIMATTTACFLYGSFHERRELRKRMKASRQESL